MRRRDSGFVLVYVILLVCLVGIFMGVLNGGTTSMIRQTNKTHLKAIERNLQLSGLAWAARNSGQITRITPGLGRRAIGEYQADETVRLDVTSLSTRPAALEVLISRSASGHPASAMIHTSCRYGTQSLDEGQVLAFE